MKYFSFILIALLFPFVGLSQNEVPKGELVWSDEFEGTGTPNPAYWDRQEYNRRNNDNGPDGWWSKEDSYLDGNGNLVIRVRKIDNKNNDGDAHDYSVGAIRTKNKFEKLYGVFEIRCKLPTQQGWWVAFWMMQGNVGSEANGGVDGSEVDIMEGFGWTDQINQAIHWDGYGDAHKSVGERTEIEGLRDDFHTYTLQWNPDEYIFYIDGEETWRTQGGGVCNQPGYLKITGELSTQEWAINQYWSKDPAAANYPDSFIVDYVKVYELPSEEVPPIRELVDKCYADGNLIVGAACHEHYLGTQTEEILDREFSYVTPANDFKQSYVHPEPGVWRWERSDKWVNHCRENNQLIRLHAPISPQCSPWAKDDSRTAKELEQNMTEYVTALCKRYNDSSQVKWLDVVNETVFHTDGRWFGPDDGSDKWNNPWPRIGFDESHELRPPLYIKKAFEIANEYGTNFKLIINQHGGMEPFIWDKIKKLVTYLRENDLRVDGIGWQAHIWMGWEKQAGNMERLAELIDWCHNNDLEFHITEFNVWLKQEDLGKLDEQANTFYEITKVAAEKQTTGFVGINYWHIRGVETQNKDRDGGPWAENYEPKEAYFKIKEALCEASPECRGECGPERLRMDVDTFGTGNSINLLKGDWQSFSDANSLDELDLTVSAGFAGKSAKFDWTLKKGAVLYPYSYAQTWLNTEKKSIDLTDYHAIKFQAGGNGLVKVGLSTAQSGDENFYFKTIVLEDEWKNVEIPFEELQQKNPELPIDTGNVVSLIFMGEGDFDDPGELWIDNIQFINKYAMSPAKAIEPPEPVVIFQPKVNQVGYIPDAKKMFSIVADSVSAGESFEIVDEASKEVFSGVLENKPIDDTSISGEMVFQGDFSTYKSPGIYRIKVGDKLSYPFQIHDQVYDSVLHHALRSYYLFRANKAIDDPLTGLIHPEGHVADESVTDGDGNFLDLSGGWYNSAGFGKYSHTTAIACAHLMNLYKINPNYFKLQNLQIPESKNDLPDILDLAKTGLKWLLKMQRDDGALYHKLDSEPHFAYGYGPDEDPFERKLENPENLSTVDAADFVAATAQASRIFASYDSLFSEQCREAALLSWKWVQSNSGIGQQDNYFTDPQSWQEEMWAKAEVYMLTENQSVLGSFYNDLNTRFLSEPTLKQPQLLSFAQLYHFPGLTQTVKNRLKIKVENYAEELKAIAGKSGYGSAIGKLEWGAKTNVKMANRGAAFVLAHQITGDDKWLNYAVQQLDYLMGRNSLNLSFVTGSGVNSVRQPFHWISKTYDIVPNGWLVQGATGSTLINNSEVDDQLKSLMRAGFPSAKIYIDSINSGSSNEVDIYSMASFAFLTGYLALHNREVEYTASHYWSGKSENLIITDKNNSLYCSNCKGETNVTFYSVTGRMLDRRTIHSTGFGTELIHYGQYLVNNPFILYQVMDETGRIKIGKLVGSKIR